MAIFFNIYWKTTMCVGNCITTYKFFQVFLRVLEFVALAPTRPAYVCFLCCKYHIFSPVKLGFSQYFVEKLVTIEIWVNLCFNQLFFNVLFVGSCCFILFMIKEGHTNERVLSTLFMFWENVAPIAYVSSLFVYFGNTNAVSVLNSQKLIFPHTRCDHSTCPF